jgi:hypothetical protein
MKHYKISSNGGNHMIKNIFLDAGGAILNENKFENNSAKII